MAWCVFTHALEHDDESIRQAAEMVFRMAVRCKPDALDGLLAIAGPWIWPETYQRLNRILQEANS